MKPVIPLDTVQRWMQSVIEHPGTNDDAWHSEEVQQHLSYDDAVANVLPSDSLTPVERIAIYRRMFFLRMTESMAIDYPAVRHFLGEEAFDRIVADEYVRKFPSRSYTLNHLGRNFPEFFRASSHPDKEFLADLAALELAVTNNLEAEETPPLTQPMIASIPADQWESVRLVPIAAMELLVFDHTVCAYLDSVTEELKPAAPEKKRTLAVVYRNNYRTFWEELSEQQFFLLSSLTAGARFGDAIAMLAERFPGAESQLQSDLFHWFNDWIGQGLFSGINR